VQEKTTVSQKKYTRYFIRYFCPPTRALRVLNYQLGFLLLIFSLAYEINLSCDIKILKILQKSEKIRFHVICVILKLLNLVVWFFNMPQNTILGRRFYERRDFYTKFGLLNYFVK